MTGFVKKLGLIFTGLLVVFTILGLWSGVESKALFKNHAGNCTEVNETTVKLSGKVDLSMRDCAVNMLSQNISDVILDSPGGDVVYGRQIGYKIGERDRTIHVENYCGSSCANYFIPAASKLVLSENAVIMLHGTPDPFTALRGYKHIDHEAFMGNVYDKIEVITIDGHNSTSRWLGDPLNRPSEEEFALRRTLEILQYDSKEETKFAKTFGVPLGWRLYRDENSTMNGWLKHFEYEQFSDSGRNLWVEEPMLRSCLSHVEFIRNTKKTKRTFFGNHILKINHDKSRDLECIAAQ